MTPTSAGLTGNTTRLIRCSPSNALKFMDIIKQGAPHLRRKPTALDLPGRSHPYARNLSRNDRMDDRKHDQETPVPRRDESWVIRNLTSQAGVPPATGRARHLIFTAFTRFGFGGKGKVYIPEYFPPFTQRLAAAEVDCSFVWNEDGLEAALDDRDTAIIHLFNEEKVCAYNSRIRAVEAKAAAVFCSHRAGLIVSQKRRANLFLTARGVSMPQLVDLADPTVPVFSNAAIGSGKRTSVIGAPEALDADRYNTRYIDTRLGFEGITYHTMFRIQTVGRRVLHAYPRARDVREKSASVHSKDTPANGPLIEFLHTTLITPRRDEIAAHAEKLGDILGPGFYAHDMVVSNSTSELFMVESGFKFNDTPYAEYLSPDADRMPSNAIFYNGQYAVRAAELFIQEWDDALTRPQPDPSGRDLWSDPAFAAT